MTPGTVVGSLPGGVVERIRERIPNYFPDITQVDQIRVTGTSHRPYSDIYRLAIDSGRIRAPEVIVKVFQGAEVQFRAMTAVWPHFSVHPTWKIPRPLDCLEEGPALVMEAVSGTTLLSRLPWIAWRGQRLQVAETDCRRAGQWLRFYHTLGVRGEPALLDVHYRRNGFEESLGELANKGFDTRPWHRLADHLGPLAERLVERPLVGAHVHGEFTADNLLIDGHQVTALDLWSKHWNAVDHDIASFLNSLLLMRLTRPVPWSALRRLRRAFLGGYFGQEQYDESAIIFLEGMELADVVVEIVIRRRSAVARAWVGYVTTGVLEALINESRRICS